MAQTVDELRAKIESYLTEANVPYRDRGPRISVRRGSSAVFIRPNTWSEQHTVVELLSPVLAELDESPKLLSRLNDINMGLYFGKAYWHDRGVWIAHNLLGDHVDREELLASVGVLATVADRLDDDLKVEFGGTRWIDS